LRRSEPFVRAVRWALVLAYFTATSLGHLAFTEWLLRPRRHVWLGDYAFKDAVPALLGSAALLLLLWVLRTAWRDPRGMWATGRYWLLWLACVAVVDRLLTYSIYEYAHYPQYAILAVLVARALEAGRTSAHPGRILFWTTLLGMLDETMQYLWITPSYGNYLDFNDFVVNLLGAAAGMMLVTGRGPALDASERPRGRMEAGCALALAVLAALAFGTGRLQLTPPQGVVVPSGGRMAAADGVVRLYLERSAGWYGHPQRSPHRGVYWVLTPAGGAVAMLLLGWVLGRYPRPPRSSPQRCRDHRSSG
jgi:VanZ family protein